MTITADPDLTADVDRIAPAVQRLVDALNDPAYLFNRDQLLHIIANVARWSREAVEDEPSELSWRAGYEVGYRARCDEENEAYRAAVLAPVFVSGELFATADCQAARGPVEPRRDDYRGGPVAPW